VRLVSVAGAGSAMSAAGTKLMPLKKISKEACQRRKENEKFKLPITAFVCTDLAKESQGKFSEKKNYLFTVDSASCE
jgi:hypothetical protein